MQVLMTNKFWNAYVTSPDIHPIGHMQFYVEELNDIRWDILIHKGRRVMDAWQPSIKLFLTYQVTCLSCSLSFQRKSPCPQPCWWSTSKHITNRWAIHSLTNGLWTLNAIREELEVLVSYAVVPPYVQGPQDPQRMLETETSTKLCKYYIFLTHTFLFKGSPVWLLFSIFELPASPLLCFGVILKLNKG